MGGGELGQAAPAASASLTLSATATGALRQGGAGTAALVLSATATASNFASASTAVGETTDAATIRFSAVATGSVEAAVIPPPAGSTAAPIKRVSITMPAPVLDSEGRPS